MQKIVDLVPANILTGIEEGMVSVYCCPSSMHELFDDKPLLANYSRSCDFCEQARIINKKCPICTMSDNYATAEAIRIDSYFEYVCPMGLYNCIVPIIVGGTPLGIYKIGRVYTDESIMRTLPRLPFSPLVDEEYQDAISHLQTLVSSIPFINYEAIRRNISSMRQSATYLETFGEKRLLNEKINACLDREKELKEKLAHSQNMLNVLVDHISGKLDYTNQLYDILSAANSLALTEQATQTSEALCAAAEAFGCTQISGELVEITQEIKNIEQYFTLQRLINSNVVFSLNNTAKFSNLYVPERSLLYLIKSYVEERLGSSGRDAYINIDISSNVLNDIDVVISDNGSIIQVSEIEKLEEHWPENMEYPALFITIYTFIRKCRQFYGNAFKFNVSSNMSGKTVTRLTFPMAHDKRKR